VGHHRPPPLLRNDGEAKQQIVREALASEVLHQDKARLDGQRTELEEQNQQISDELRTTQLMVQDHLILIASLQERLQKSEPDVP